MYELWERLQKSFHKENNLIEYGKESWGVMCTFDVTEPTLTVYRAKEKNTGKSVIIIPGGGYSLAEIRYI